MSSVEKTIAGARLRIAVASDLHLEHADLERFEHRDADLIVLAGSIDVLPFAGGKAVP